MHDLVLVKALGIRIMLTCSLALMKYRNFWSVLDHLISRYGISKDGQHSRIGLAMPGNASMELEP